MSITATDTYLPDCTACGGRVVLDIDGGGAREVCQRCGIAQRMTARVDRAGIRQAVRQVRRAPLLMCPSCQRKRCSACHVVTCECPRRWHPRRPAGDIHPEGMALLAGERNGHLAPGEVE